MFAWAEKPNKKKSKNAKPDSIFGQFAWKSNFNFLKWDVPVCRHFRHLN